MTVVQNTELTPGMTPAEGVRVEISVGGVPAATYDFDNSLVATTTVESDAAGYWSANLIPNSQILPRGTWYIFRRIYPTALGGQRIEQYLLVPESGSPISFEELVVSSQDAPRLTNSELTDHLAHINPHPNYLTELEADDLYEPLGGGSGGPPFLSTDISDFDSAVDILTVAHSLDEFAVPDTDLSMGTHKITGLADGENTSHAINLGQLVDHEANVDPHSAADYAIMLGGGRHLYVQNSTPSGVGLFENDVWIQQDPLRVQYFDGTVWQGQYTAGLTNVIVPQPEVGAFVVTAHNGTGSTSFGTTGTMFLSPVDVAVQTTFDRIGTSITVVGTGTALVIRLGFYADDGTLTRPMGAPLLDAGTVDPTSGTGDKLITISRTLAAGRYWLAWVLQGTVSGNPTIVTITAINQIGLATLGNNSHREWTQTGVTGALPTIATLTRGATSPIAGLRVS